MDALIFKTLQRVQAESDEAKQAELKAETNEELAQHFMRHPADMEELAFDLLNLAWSDTLQGDIVRDLIEVKTVGLGDPDYVEEDLRGMRAYWQGKGGQIRSDILRYERAQMPREEIVTAIDMHQDEFQLDFWGSFGKLSTQAQEKMRTLPAQRLIELVQAAITAGTTFGSFASSTLSDDQVDSVLDEVALRSGGNFENFEGQFVLPNDELWIVGRNAGRLTYYGASAKVQQLRLPSFYFRWETARDAGMLLYGAPKGRLGRIVLT
jgi:hypothetical protein